MCGSGAARQTVSSWWPAGTPSSPNSRGISSRQLRGLLGSLKHSGPGLFTECVSFFNGSDGVVYSHSRSDFPLGTLPRQEKPQLPMGFMGTTLATQSPAALHFSAYASNSCPLSEPSPTQVHENKGIQEGLMWRTWVS